MFLLKVVVDGTLEVGVAVGGHFHPREQVTDDALEQGKVLVQEFWDIGVSHGPNQDDVFLEMGILTS